MEDLVLNIITDIIGDSCVSVEPQTLLVGSGLIDSLDFLSLVEKVENTFNIRVDNNDLTVENFGTMDKICRYIDKVQ